MSERHQEGCHRVIGETQLPLRGAWFPSEPVLRVGCSTHIATYRRNRLVAEQAPCRGLLVKTALANGDSHPFRDPDVLDTPDFWHWPRPTVIFWSIATGTP